MVAVASACVPGCKVTGSSYGPLLEKLAGYDLEKPDPGFETMIVAGDKSETWT